MISTVVGPVGSESLGDGVMDPQKSYCLGPFRGQGPCGELFHKSRGRLVGVSVDPDLFLLPTDRWRVRPGPRPFRPSRSSTRLVRVGGPELRSLHPRRLYLPSGSRGGFPGRVEPKKELLEVPVSLEGEKIQDGRDSTQSLDLRDRTEEILVSTPLTSSRDPRVGKSHTECE